jgi:hypothetical protein
MQQQDAGQARISCFPVKEADTVNSNDLVFDIHIRVLFRLMFLFVADSLSKVFG